VVSLKGEISSLKGERSHLKRNVEAIIEKIERYLTNSG